MPPCCSKEEGESEHHLGTVPICRAVEKYAAHVSGDGGAKLPLAIFFAHSRVACMGACCLVLLIIIWVHQPASVTAKLTRGQPGFKMGISVQSCARLTAIKIAAYMKNTCSAYWAKIPIRSAYAFPITRRSVGHLFIKFTGLLSQPKSLSKVFFRLSYQRRYNQGKLARDTV